MNGPIVIAIEDLHWADPGTVGVVAQLARGIATLPAALVVSARPQPRRGELRRLLDLLESRGGVRIALEPLGEKESVELVETLLGAPAGPRLRRQAAGAAGNPLFVSELVGTLAEDDDVLNRALASTR
jgi:predicted ATPase